jgi:hypothetical protein
MTKFLFVLSITGFVIFNCYSQQATTVQKTTPVVAIQNAEKTAPAAPAGASHDHSKCAHDKSCCKGKKGKACCKGKNAKSCHAKDSNASNNGNAPHNCAHHKSAATDGAAKPVCCAAKKDGSSCAHHHGHQHKEEGK